MTSKPLKIALFGNSNVGKSTLFNSLTGLNQKTTNAPGTTISVETGMWQNYELVDLPGLISMCHISPDEEVSANAIMNKDSQYRPDVILLVASALHMSRALYLLAQAKSSGIPIILCITMADLAIKHGVKINVEQIKDVTGVEEVVIIDARKKSVAQPQLLSALNVVEKSLKENQSVGVEDVKEWAKSNSDKHFHWVFDAEKQLGFNKTSSVTFIDRLDRLILNKIAGGLIFFTMMFIIFEITTSFANPIIDLFDISLRGQLSNILSNLEPILPHLIYDFLVSVLLEALITVLTFLPPMFLMFICLAVLEESGYLSRAAFVSDRYMRLLGLDGRAILPLILGYGCNLPAISGTKILPDAISRRTTAYLIPFTLCSARLSVFVVLAHAFFPYHEGIIIFSLYLISILTVVIIGIIMNLFNKKQVQRLPFIISLPPYQLPDFASTIKSSFTRLMIFIKTCGIIILAVIFVLWDCRILKWGKILKLVMIFLPMILLQKTLLFFLNRLDLMMNILHRQ